MSSRGTFRLGREGSEDQEVVKKTFDDVCLMFDDVFAANLFFLISGRISHVQGGKWKGTWSCPGQIQVITTRADTGGEMFLLLSWDCRPIVKYGEVEYCMRDGAGVPPVAHLREHYDF